MDEAGGYGAGSATSRVGVSFGTRLPETFYEDFTTIIKACEIEEEEETSGSATTLHAPVLETPAVGPSARVRPRVMNGGGGKAGDHDDDVGEGAERATLSSCGEWKVMDEAGDYGGRVATDNDVRMEVAMDMTSKHTGSRNSDGQPDSRRET